VPESSGIVDVRPILPQRVVIVRAFIKKTEKTPTAEIELALQRAKQLWP
jgi:phage-related protein